MNLRSCLRQALLEPKHNVMAFGTFGHPHSKNRNPAEISNFRGRLDMSFSQSRPSACFTLFFQVLRWVPWMERKNRRGSGCFRFQVQPCFPPTESGEFARPKIWPSDTKIFWSQESQGIDYACIFFDQFSHTYM